MSFIRKIKRGGKVYLAEVENKWIDGKCIQKHLRYVGKEADGQTLLSTSLSDVAVDSVKLYGPLLVLNFLAQEIGLAQLLGDYGDEILSLVYAHCLDYKSLNQMPQWFARTDLNLLLALDGLTEKRLLNALDALEAHDAEKLQQAIFAAVQKRYHLPVSGVIYDVTNTYLSGKKCPLAKYGHDKEGVKGRPLIQIGLGVTEEHGIPLFHKVFAGNIHDARTLHDLISCFQSYEVGSGVIVYFDRGSTSAQNIRDIRRLRWHSLCGLAIRGRLKETLRPLLATRKFIALPNRVCLNKTIFYVITTTYEWGGTKGILAVCFNEQQQRLLREARYEKLLQARQQRKAGQAINPGLEQYFDKKGHLIAKRVAEAEEFDGVSCIFSTKRLSKEQIVRAYFDKDLVEKAFRTLKGITRLHPVRHWLYNRTTAHVFVCYLAYLLLALLKYRLRKLGLAPQRALAELDSMYKVYLRDTKKGFVLSRIVTLTKQQETILRAISPTLLKS